MRTSDDEPRENSISGQFIEMLKTQKKKGVVVVLGGIANHLPHVANQTGRS
jgi:hypothetical protein